MNKFGKTYQLKDMIYDLSKDTTEELGSMYFEGYTKVHGTNAGVSYLDGVQTPQSRNRDLSVSADNFGFANWHSEHLAYFHGAFKFIEDVYGCKGQEIVIYGEWAGRGIQQSVAVSEVPRFYYIFAIKVVREGGDEWLTTFPKCLFTRTDIVSKKDVPSYGLMIDLNNPSLMTNALVAATDAVEEECPVGKYFGVTGVGEGIVWENITKGRRISFKVKGAAHTVNKCIVLAPVNEELLQSIKLFLDDVVTPARLEQGVQETGGLAKGNIGKFLAWVVKDIQDEEKLTIEANGYGKELGRAVVAISKPWILSQFN